MRAHGFDRIARPYRWMERLCFGGALERCRASHLSLMARAANTLVLGDGDGRFTSALFAANPQVRVVAIDASPAMLRLLTARVGVAGDGGRLTTIAASLPDLFLDLRASRKVTWPEAGFDLVVSHFFLDCLTTADVAALVQSLRPRLAPGADWVVSEFATPTLWAAAIVRGLYLAFRLLAGVKVRKLPACEQVLAAAGFTLSAKKLSLGGLLVSSLWTLAGREGNQRSRSALP